MKKIYKDFQNNEEDELNDQLDALNKKRARVFDSLWSLEEQQTILGLLKAKKKRKT